MTLLEEVAMQHRLDPKLVQALILVESGGSAWAWNPEPRYPYLWNVKYKAPFRSLLPAESASETPPSDFPALAGDRDQEWWAQQASWGLMQVMGAVAREMGCVSPYLTELCGEELNLEVGCEHLERLMKWANGNVEQALAAWNGGKGGNVVKPFRNQAYADKVLAKVRSL